MISVALDYIGQDFFAYLPLDVPIGINALENQTRGQVMYAQYVGECGADRRAKEDRIDYELWPTLGIPRKSSRLGLEEQVADFRRGQKATTVRWGKATIFRRDTDFRPNQSVGRDAYA
jgi:hypothetical protein